jgi:hypothetical protein
MATEPTFRLSQVVRLNAPRFLKFRATELGRWKMSWVSK